MGLLSFIKEAGTKLFGKKEEEAPVAEQENLKASALIAHVQFLNLPFKSLKVYLQGGTVTLKGEVDKQVDSEKIALAVGNIEGVSEVDNQMDVAAKEPEARYHTVVSGDTLSKIAKTYYGEANKYNMIFEANKPMLTDPDKIYPGQVLRIPNE
jgi:nucleoid-associated protein YgaU